MFFDAASDDFEYLRDMLLDEISDKDQRDYCMEWCKHRLLEVKYRVAAIMPDILLYITAFFDDPPVVYKEDILLPELPYKKLPEMGDFLLGCYWILQKGRRNVLDYGHFLKAADPTEQDHKQAVLRYAAADIIEAHTGFPLWPWPEQGNPFYE